MKGCALALGISLGLAAPFWTAAHANPAAATQTHEPTTAAPDSAAAAPNAELKKRAATGDAEAEAQLGFALSGSKNAAEQKAAYNWFRKSAAQGNVDGEWGLGNAYVSGHGVARNMRTGAAWMRKSFANPPAKPSEAYANRMLMYGMLVAPLVTHGSKQRSAAADRWIRRSAKAGSPMGMMFVAMGELPRQGKPGNAAAAHRWLRKAANLGAMDAQEALGLLDVSGHVWRANIAEGLHWLQLAARHGDAEAAGYLGAYLISGKSGVPKNPAAGVKWANAAVASSSVLGTPLGYYALGYAYEYGRGVPASPTKAWYNFAAAARLGKKHEFHDVNVRLSQVARNLSPAEIKRLGAAVAKLPTPTKTPSKEHFGPSGAAS